MYRIQDGIEKIPRSIIKELQENSRVDLNLNSRCDSISISKNEATVSFNGESQKTDHIISTLPAFALAGLLR
jgi:protoporphyrinogen oxidase